MSSVTSHPELVTIGEYFRREEASEAKHDYANGEMLAMAGGTREHSILCLNIGGELRTRLKGKRCQPYDANFRFGIPNRPFAHYPDASVVCGDIEYDPRDKRRQTFTNPALIVEVLSPSTANFDRGEKFDRYRLLESLREYVLIFQDRAEVQTFLKDDDGTWSLGFTTGPDAILKLRSLAIEIPMAEIYDRITFPPPADAEIPAE